MRAINSSWSIVKNKMKHAKELRVQERIWIDSSKPQR